MVQHVLPKGFKRIRYDGVQATKTFAKVKAVIHAALAKVEGVGKGAVTIMARLTYRQRYEQSTGRDPFRCPHCGAEMAVWRIWHPKYGVIYDEGEVIKRGTYTSTAQRAGPCRQADIPQVRPEGVMCISFFAPCTIVARFQHLSQACHRWLGDTSIIVCPGERVVGWPTP